jgi:hypothetical protein
VSEVKRLAKVTKQEKKEESETKLFNYTRLLIQAEKDPTCFAFIL